MKLSVALRGPQFNDRTLGRRKDESGGEVPVDSQAHWQKVWTSKKPDEVSWFEPEAGT